MRRCSSQRFGRADLHVCSFAEQVVGEVVAVAELVHDPAPPQLVDRPYHGVGVEVARLSEQVEGEVRPHRRRQAGHLPGGRGRLLQTVAQHRGEITGRPGVLPRSTLPRTASMTYKREAARRGLEQARVGLLERPPGDRLGQTRCVGDLERAEGKLREQSGGPHPDGPVREFGVIKVVVAQCPGHENLGAGRQPQAEREEGQGLLVAPLHIVQDQQHRAADGQQRPGEALEEAMALPGVGHGPGSGCALAAAAGRHQPVDLGAPGRVQRRRRRLDCRVPHPVSHRCQRQPARCAEALGTGHHCAL